ncbi:MAG: tyrosine-type recombinase/integrase [Victivallaceae bacterium]|nr:tyrosine-type recombinase/integrase [Victivallaceae bacterium]
MSVFKRKTKYSETKEYHYKFMQDGKCLFGVCEGCTSERDALAFEKKIKDIAKSASKQKTIKALLDNFREELTGSHKIMLDEAYELYLKHPTRRPPGELQIKRNRTYFTDFVKFMKSKYPQIECLADVAEAHAGEYITLLRNSGAFDKHIEFVTSRGTSAGYVSSATLLSPRTINARHKAIKAVFARLGKEAGLAGNPFDVDTLEGKTVNRDIFTDEEICKIGENMTMPYIRPIFTIGLFTGLTMGDICLLKWEEIDGPVITHKKRRKTGVDLEIPILQPLAAFLEEQRGNSTGSEYVSPELAEMYLKNPGGVFYRMRIFLNSIGIATARDEDGRSRKTAVKATHSLRHTFAYMAGVYNIPQTIVQSILGHMSPEMTKHYQAHATREAKERYLSQLPNLLSAAPDTEREASTSSGRERLIELINHLPDDKIQSLLEYAERLP